MPTNDNHNNDATQEAVKKAGCSLYFAALSLVWIALIASKVVGLLKMGWFFVISAVVWANVPLLMVWMFGLLIVTFAKQLGQALRVQAHRRRTWKKLKDAMDGFTLNKIGPIYGVDRVKGETNQSYQRRIKERVYTTDTVIIERQTKAAQNEASAQGKIESIENIDIDRIGEQYGVIRFFGESDVHYRRRVIDTIRRATE